jgi:hypothetical protein
MKTQSLTFFKIGAWILVLAGFAHAAVAFFDAFIAGAFSPDSADVLEALQNTSLNIALWLHGSHTAVFESAWGAYTGFAIAVGFLTGFVGLVLLLAINYKNAADTRNRRLFNTALVMSAVMTVIAALFYFWFPLSILATSLVCFIIAVITLPKGISYAAR